MKILIAPNAFKGSLSARRVCDLLTEGMIAAASDFEIVTTPLADGGDGTLEVLVENWGGRIEEISARDPLGRRIVGPIGFDSVGRRAIVEMARFSGLALLDEDERNPLAASSIGTGDAILEAIRRGAREIVLCIGGSATNDGGAGMGSVLGFPHFDASGKPLDPRGGNLGSIDRISRPGPGVLPEDLRVTVLCDVANPLCGENGASQVYGPQKGATPAQVAEMDGGLAHLATRWSRDLGRDVADEPGAGAAGGMGAGAMAYLDAELVSGSGRILELTDLEGKVGAADVVITGEGALDPTSLSGKIPGRVANLAKKHSRPCYGICGVFRSESVEPFFEAGFTEVREIAPSEIPLADRLARAGFWVKTAGRRLGERLSGRGRG